MPRKLNLLAVILLFVIGTLATAGQPMNVFLLSFDNYYQDAEIDWLRGGFVDFIEDYLKNNFDINVQRTSKIEATLNQIKKTGNNYLLTGSYYREQGKFYISIELTDLGTWKSVGTRQVESTTTDFGKIVEQVNQAVAELLGLVQPGSYAEAQVTPATITPDSLKRAISQSLASFKATATATQKFSFAVEQLDARLKTPPTEGSYTTASIRIKPQASKSLGDLLQSNADFNKVLNYIIQNPYEIEIGEPSFQRLPMREDQVKVNFEITYKLRREIIREMLETIPYRYRHDLATYTEYLYGGDKVVIEPELRNRITRGDYRSFPVITLSNSSGAPIYRIFDLPAFTTKTLRSAPHIKYVNSFVPRFSLSASSWDVKIWLYHEDLKVTYGFEIGLEELQQVRGITVTVLPEREALQILDINP